MFVKAGYARRSTDRVNFEIIAASIIGRAKHHTAGVYHRRPPPKREPLTSKLSIGPLFELVAHHRPKLDPGIIS